MDRRIQTLIQKGYPLEIINYLQDYSKDEVNTAVEKLMKDISVNNNPTNSPNVYFIGGQPGSGKSALMNRIRLTESVNGIVNIQMDEYRMMNPKIEEIEQYILEHYEKGMTEVHLLGGVNPSHTFEHYKRVVSKASELLTKEVTIKAFTAVEHIEMIT